MSMKIFTLTILPALSLSLLIQTGCANRSYPSGYSNFPNGNSGGGTSTTTGTQSPAGPVPTGSGTIAGMDYAGNGTGTVSASTASGAAAIAPTIDAQAPESYAYLPPSIAKTATAMAQDPTNAALRMQLAGEIMTACATDAATLAPQPGEPLMGDWLATCTDTGEITYVYVTAKYPTQSGSFGTGLAKFYSAAANSSDAGIGMLSLNTQGDANAYYVTTYGTYLATFTDKPTAGTAVAQLVSGGSGGVCSTVAAALSVSRNPIPKKHTEAMSRLGACYRQAMVFVSPIIYGYVYNLNPAAAQSIFTSFNYY